MNADLMQWLEVKPLTDEVIKRLEARAALYRSVEHLWVRLPLREAEAAVARLDSEGQQEPVAWAESLGKDISQFSD